MTSRYVAVPSEALRKKLTEMGFKPTAQAWSEEVYERPHHKDPNFIVRVYTSISTNQSKVRGCGEDAIRVVALIKTREGFRGIARTKRVYRTGTVEGVLERLYERAREAYASINESRKRAETIKKKWARRLKLLEKNHD